MPKAFLNSGGTNEELTLRRGNIPSLHESTTTFLKSNALVSRGPMTCIPLRGSPLNGTEAPEINVSSNLTKVEGSTFSPLILKELMEV